MKMMEYASVDVTTVL